MQAAARALTRRQEFVKKEKSIKFNQEFFMALTTLKYLIYLQSKRGFKRELELVENIFKVYDLENDRTFVKYDDLQLLINFATKLQERGWSEGTDFYFNTVGVENRLTLVNGNIMVEYNEWHDFEFLEKPMPQPNYDPLIYLWPKITFAAFTLSGADPQSTVCPLDISNLQTGLSGYSFAAPELDFEISIT